MFSTTFTFQQQKELIASILPVHLLCLWHSPKLAFVDYSLSLSLFGRTNFFQKKKLYRALSFQFFSTQQTSYLLQSNLYSYLFSWFKLRQQQREGLGHLNKQSPRCCKANKLVMRILFRLIFFPTFCDWRWAEFFFISCPRRRRP